MSWTARFLLRARSAIESRRVRIAIVVAAELAYVGLFVPLRAVMGGSVGVFALPPVLLAGFLLGSTPGVGLGLTNGLLSVVLYALTDGEEAAHLPLLTRHAVPALVFVLFGWMSGSLSVLAKRQGKVQGQLQASLAREREANLALCEREARLAMAQELAQLGGWAADFTTGREWWSPELCRLFALDPRRAGEIGGLWFDLVHADDRQRVADAIVEAVTGQRTVQLELRVVRGDGEVRQAVGRIRPVTGEQGRISRIVAAVQDVTELQKIQERLAAAERSASLGALVSRVAHEINNPLACVVSNAHFALKELDEPIRDEAWLAETREALRETLAGAERVRKCVQDLRALAQSADPIEPRAEREQATVPAGAARVSAGGTQVPAAAE
jgi:PAS domain S-box-containing protein